MGGISAPAAVNSIRAISRQIEMARKRAVMTPRALSLINAEYNIPELDCDKQYDLVYILKPSEFNLDLRASLRSIERFCTFRKVWIIGYKPEWLQNVSYIHTDQTGNKWQNSCLNWKTACECPDISENFILMNDDFIALHPIRDWKTELNVYIGSINEEAEKWGKRKKPSRWQYGFIYAKDLLEKCHAKTDYNYEAHVPIIINKQQYLNFLQLKPIREILQTNKVLHKRSLYKNLYPEKDLDTPHKIRDVKILLGYDLSDIYLKENWLSVFDDVIGSGIKFPKVNKFLDEMFPNKSHFEAY